MERRKFSRSFKLEAVRLVRERELKVTQPARDLEVRAIVLRSWIREFAGDPRDAFPGNSQMKPKQLETESLRRELVKLKAERDSPKNAAAYFARDSS